MKRVSFIVLGFLVAACLLGPATTKVSAAGTLTYDDYDVIIDINADGTVDVTEIMDARLQGDLNGGERSIPRGRFDAITDVQLTVDDTPYAISIADEMTDMPVGVCRVVRTWEDYHIRWRTRHPTDPIYENESLRFVLRYRVHGAIHWYPNLSRFEWNAIPPNRDAAIPNPSVRVNLPPDLKRAGYDIEHDVAKRLLSDAPEHVINVSDSAVEFETGALNRGVNFTVRIDLPSDVVDSDFSINAYLRGGLGVLLLIVALPLCALITWIRWRMRGRDPDPILDQAYYQEPPDDTPPGVVAALLEEQAKVHAVTATILDLAERGVIRIEKLDDDDQHRFILERDASNELTRWEKTLVNGLFDKNAQPGATVESSELKNEFHTTCSKVEDQIWEETLSRDFFEGRPRRIVLINVGIGAAIAAVGLLLMAISNPISGFLGVWASLFGGIPGVLFVSGIVSKEKSIGQKVGLLILLPFMVGGAIGFGFGVSLLVTAGWFPLIHFPGLILLMLGLLTIVSAPAMPRKTQKGADVAAKWRRFRDFLEREEPFALENDEGGATFGAFLAAAVALGVERQWGRRFADMAVLTSPGWYHDHHHLHHGHMHSHGASPGGFSAGDLTGSITSMASSIGATFASSPSSSGSGGGFSSGGGGGGGGGGSAGGW